MATPKWLKIDKTKAREIQQDSIRRELSESDKDMARVGEDLLDVLISKGVLALTDLPKKAQETINKRKSKRNDL